MTRTDIHRPSAIEPEAYDFVALRSIKVEGLEDVAIIKAEREIFEAHKAAHPGAEYSHHEHGGNCYICGAHCIYMAIFYHRESNAYIATGMDCASKMEMGDANRFRVFKNAIDAAREHKAGMKKAMGILELAGIPLAWRIYSTDYSNKPLKYEERTIRDIVGKLIKYGSISPKAMNLLKDLVERIPRREEIAAERAAEKEAAAPCPTGKVEVTGTVLKTEVREGYYGSQVVMVVKADAGFMLWGTRPKSLAGGDLKGKRIWLKAAVTPSDKDPKFGFFKRPQAGLLPDDWEATAAVS